MKTEMRRQLAREPFEQKIHKIGQLIQLAAKLKAERASANLESERAALLRDQIMEVKNGTGLTKIEPKRKPVKYSSRGGGTPRRRGSRV